MKNEKLIMILAIFLLPLAAHAQRKQMNLVGSLGMATGNIEGLIVNLGIEMEVFQHFYAQVSFDNFFEGGSTMAYVREGQVSFPQTMRTRVFGMNLLGTFKLPLSRRVEWFTKAGLSYTHRSRYFNDNYYYDSFGYNGYGGYGGYYDYDPGLYSMEDTTPMRTGLVYALGTGIEHRLTEKLALIVGGTYESLFDQTLSAEDGEKPGHWMKFYVGVNYRLR
jgi:hypothetical protein